MPHYTNDSYLGGVKALVIIFFSYEQRQQRQVLATSLEVDDRVFAGMGVKLITKKV